MLWKTKLCMNSGISIVQRRQKGRILFETFRVIVQTEKKVISHTVSFLSFCQRFTCESINFNVDLWFLRRIIVPVYWTIVCVCLRIPYILYLHYLSNNRYSVILTKSKCQQLRLDPDGFLKQNKLTSKERYI